jgi:hypothetical protein
VITNARARCRSANLVYHHTPDTVDNSFRFFTRTNYQAGTQMSLSRRRFPAP